MDDCRGYKHARELRPFGRELLVTGDIAFCFAADNPYRQDLKSKTGDSHTKRLNEAQNSSDVRTSRSSTKKSQLPN